MPRRHERTRPRQSRLAKDRHGDAILPEMLPGEHWPTILLRRFCAAARMRASRPRCSGLAATQQQIAGEHDRIDRLSQIMSDAQDRELSLNGSEGFQV